MKTIAAILLLLALAMPAHADGLKLDFARDDWHRDDTELLAGAVAILAVDWAQTRNISRDPAHEEGNLLLGSRPSLGRVNAYFLAAMGGTVLLSFALPPTERRWILGGLILFEGFVIFNNKQAGIKASF